MSRRVPMDLIIRLVAVLSLVVATWAVVDTRNRANCQASINEALVSRTAILTQATDDERNAQRAADDAFAALISASLAQPAVSPDEGKKLVNDLNVALVRQHQEREQADTARAANPPPQLPSQVC